MTYKIIVTSEFERKEELFDGDLNGAVKRAFEIEPDYDYVNIFIVDESGATVWGNT